MPARLPRAGIPSIDRDTSGLLVVARTLEAQTDLVRVSSGPAPSKRHYLALSMRPWPARRERRVNTPIGRHRSSAPG